MKFFAKCSGVLVAVAAIVLFTGCEMFQTGDEPSVVPQVTYRFGQLKTSEVNPLDHTWKSTLQAMDDLHFPITSTDKDPLRGELTAKGEGKEIQIILEETTITTTEIRIRAGTIGDKALSFRVLKAIERRL